MNAKKINKEKKKKFSDEQRKRFNNVAIALKSSYASIHVKYDLDFEKATELRSISAALSSVQLVKSNFAKSNKHLSFFYENRDKWALLNQIFLLSNLGKASYKELLSKKINVSDKTLQKYIAQGLKAGLLVKMKPFLDVSTDGRIKNIRPSEEVIIAYSQWCIVSVREDFKFLLTYGNREKLLKLLNDKTI
jgi:hypothetical protein